jgi:hypothetical protein
MSGMCDPGNNGFGWFQVSGFGCANQARLSHQVDLMRRFATMHLQNARRMLFGLPDDPIGEVQIHVWVLVPAIYDSDGDI